MPTAMPRRFGVVGAGSVQANGVFEVVEGALHHDMPVYASLGGYQLSISQSPEAETGELRWGWVIGREGFPAYGCPTDARSHVPCRGWQCFCGKLPAPEVAALEEAGEALAAAYEEEAQAAAIKGNFARALSAYSRALVAIGPERLGNEALKAQLLAGRGKVHQALDRFDAALADSDAALALRPDLPTAILLRAQVLRETGEVVDAALSAKQYLHLKQHVWNRDAGRELHMYTSSLVEAPGSLRSACELLLGELGHAADDALPQGYRLGLYLEDLCRELSMAGPDDKDASGIACVLGVEVSNCGTEGCAGVYQRSVRESHGGPVFEGPASFCLSVEVLPVKGAGTTKYGWVIGRDRVGYYGARVDTPDADPPEAGWSSFGAAGKAPAPTCALLRAARGATKEAQGGALANAVASIRAARLLQSAATAGESLTAHADALVGLSMALREVGRLGDARACAEEALLVWPHAEEAYLEKARALEASGEEAAAAKSLRQLLAVRPAHRGVSEMLLGLANRDAVPPEVRAPDTLEDRPSEVYVHWTLPQGTAGKDLQVSIRAEHLAVVLAGRTLFDRGLAHRIKPSESSWTFAAPDLSLQLSKAMEDGKWPRWETLHLEEPKEREARLGGLPFDLSKVQYM